jgi:hypothetical protein
VGDELWYYYESVYDITGRGEIGASDRKEGKLQELQRVPDHDENTPAYRNRSFIPPMYRS